MTIGESILKHRKDMGLSQEELAERLLVSRQTISLWETDQTQPTIENLMRLRDVFGVSIDRVLCAEEKETKINDDSMDTICAALAYAMGIEPPRLAAEKNSELANYVDKVFDGGKADRIIMYNPDGIAEWIYRKYYEYFNRANARVGKKIFLSAVMPSVAPACFGTMYTGVQPEIHGIQKYEKPVISTETLFDALIAAGKKPAIISYGKNSVGKIFRERNMDYFHFEEGDICKANAKAIELIIRDEHDFLVLHNGNYDALMHKNGPESARALSELRLNDHVFGLICELVRNNWQHHNTLIGFAMGHGCHEIDGGVGSHGLYMPEDINVAHLYRGYPEKN